MPNAENPNASSSERESNVDPDDNSSLEVSGESESVELISDISWLPSSPPGSGNDSTAHVSRAASDPMQLSPGDIFGDFMIRGELGRGAFGVVLLAEQLSLRRPVALKVTPVRSVDACEKEGLALAQLDHPSIVRVYSQTIDTKRQCRTLCMQFVTGMTLRRLMHTVQQQFGDDWCGRHLLNVLDDTASEAVVLDASSVKDRAALGKCDRIEAICWLGAQLASALDHAHQMGIVHRDIKPENIIVNQFGRPMLVDFNLALQQSADEPKQSIGGTIPYMAPESLAELVDTKRSHRDGHASDQPPDQPPDRSPDHSSDLYSLGIVLWELASRFRPYAIGVIDDQTTREDLNSCFEVSPAGHDQVPSTLRPILKRTIAYEPGQRFDSAKQLAENLVGASHQSGVIRWRDSYGRLGRSVIKHPILWLFAAASLPHVCSSVLQVAYNLTVILSRLDTSALGVFHRSLFVLNVLIYGVCVVIGVRYLRVIRVWNDDQQGVSCDREMARSELLRLPIVVAIIGSSGWLAAAIGFPGLIHFLASPLSPQDWAHFLFSFGFAGTMAVTYAYALMNAVLVIGIYPECHADVSRFRERAHAELLPIRERWGRLSLLAGVIPLAAAIVLVLTHDPTTTGNRAIAFQVLMTAWIVAGAGGFAIVGIAGRPALRLIDRCLDSDSRSDSSR